MGPDIGEGLELPAQPAPVLLGFQCGEGRADRRADGGEGHPGRAVEDRVDLLDVTLLEFDPLLLQQVADGRVEGIVGLLLHEEEQEAQAGEEGDRGEKRAHIALLAARQEKDGDDRCGDGQGG